MRMRCVVTRSQCDCPTPVRAMSGREYTEDGIEMRPRQGRSRVIVPSFRWLLERGAETLYKRRHYKVTM